MKSIAEARVTFDDASSTPSAAVLPLATLKVTSMRATGDVKEISLRAAKFFAHPFRPAGLSQQRMIAMWKITLRLARNWRLAALRSVLLLVLSISAACAGTIEFTNRRIDYDELPFAPSQVLLRLESA